MKKISKRPLSLFLALTMAFGLLLSPASSIEVAAAQEAQATKILDTANRQVLFTQEQLEALSLVDRSARTSGLVGFDGEYALGDDDELVSVIVEFIHQPPLVQRAEALASGKRSILSVEQATVLAEEDHDNFRSEMDDLFGVTPNSRSSAPYKVTSTYTDALNGVAVVLPSGMVEEMAKLDSVYAIYPNVTISIDPQEVVTEAAAGEAGLGESRAFWDIDQLHTEGLTGNGIIVGVLDTGVDYNHPDLEDAFASNVDDLNLNGSGLQPYNGKYYGRNYVVIDGLTRDPYDPMETTYKEMIEAGADEYSGGNAFYTSHGTHVSGTIAGRGNDSTAMSTLGIAPDATLLVYRVLGAYGTGHTEWTLSAIDQVYADGCDVVNLSLGAAVNDPTYASSIAINNLIIAHENLIFCIAAGNAGPKTSTLGSPGTSSLAITVGNGTVPMNVFNMTAQAVEPPVYFEPSGAELSAEIFTESDGGGAALQTEEPDNGEAVETEEPDDGEAVETEEPDNSEAVETEEPDNSEAVETEESDNSEVANPETVSTAKRVMQAFTIPAEDQLALLINGYPNDFTDNLDGTYSITSGAGISQYELVLIEKIDSAGDDVTISGTVLGFGTSAEFEAASAAGVLTNKIAVVSRGQAFVDTAEYAKKAGAAGVIVITNSSGTLSDFVADSPKYVPVFITSSRDAGIALVTEAVENGGIKFTDKRSASSGNTLANSSSRGPVGNTLDIKPDIVAPGSAILAPAPFFITADDKMDYETPGSYDYAQQRMSGTSMATPHVAGVAALMLEYCDDELIDRWDATELKARMMNTANELTGDYSVHEVGAGYLSPRRAIESDIHVTVLQPNGVFREDSENGMLLTGEGRFASFNFRAFPIEVSTPSSLSLAATVHNDGDTDKTFDITIEQNYVGFEASGQDIVADAGKWSGSGITVEASDDQVEVIKNSTEDFAVEVQVPANVALEYEGVYEGYVILTETGGGGEVYRLPFSMTLMSNDPLDVAFLSHPVISTNGVEFVDLGNGRTGYVWDSEVVHNDESLFSAFVFQYTGVVDNITFYLAPFDIKDEDLSQENKFLGEFNNGFFVTPNGYETGVVYSVSGAILPVYYNYAQQEWMVVGEGAYKAIARVQTDLGYSYYPMDFYVDNTLPELAVTGLSSNDAYTYSGNSREEAVLSGTIVDAGLTDMAAKGINFELYEEGDVHGPVPDQALNAIFAKVSGSNKYIQAVIQPNGSFTLPLTGLSETGTTNVEIYYLDSFAAAIRGGGVTGFDPAGLCMSEVYGQNFSFYGLNLAKKNITMTHTGKAVTLNSTNVTLSIDDTFQFTTTFNQEATAAGYNSVSWASSDNRIATVDSSGLITARAQGVVKITATSNNPGAGAITASSTVRVTGAGDGVQFKAGDLVWMGRSSYEDYTVDITKAVPVTEYGVNWNPNLTTDFASSPMIWEIMGDEGDGYLTMMSAFALGTGEYFSLPAGASANDVVGYLNGTFFNNSFTATEKNSIPSFNVTTGRYSTDGALVTTSTAENQRVYLPWGIYKDAASEFASSVFWTAGNTTARQYARVGDSLTKNRIRARNMTKTVFGTYYLRTPSADGNTTLAVKGFDGAVTELDNFNRHSAGHDYSSQYGNFGSVSVGVTMLPLTKIDLESVVYAYRVQLGQRHDQEEGYMSVQEAGAWPAYDSGVSGREYKLTLLNEAIGTISGISPEGRAIEEGQKVKLDAVTTSANGGDYKIAYKVVGTVDGERKIVDYGEFATSAAAQNLTLHTNKLEAGDYQVYVWLQKNNTLSSHEASAAQRFPLTVEPVGTVDVGDGVSLQVGSYVYYGAYKHGNTYNSPDGIAFPRFRPGEITAWDAQATPVLWQVMGEEVDEAGNGDGYTTIMSRYVLDSWQFSRSKSLNWGHTFPYSQSTMELELNKKFSDSFSNAEYNAIPFMDLKLIGYSEDEYRNANSASDTVYRQKVYLPWGLRYTGAGDTLPSLSVKSIFWSAGNKIINENGVAIKYDERTDDLSRSIATLKNGNAASYWLSSASTGSDFNCVNYVYSTGKFFPSTFMAPDYSAGYTGGIRPITKLTPESILYAAKVGTSLEVEPDGVNYIEPDSDNTYYKLTVLGSHSGADIGTLSGVPASTRINPGSMLNLANVNSSVSGAEYSIAYKLVGGPSGSREIIEYGELDATGVAQDITLDTSALPQGNYSVYAWLQKNNAASSNEAGVVSKLSLTIGYNNVVTPAPEEPAPAPAGPTGPAATEAPSTAPETPTAAVPAYVAEVNNSGTASTAVTAADVATAIEQIKDQPGAALVIKSELAEGVAAGDIKAMEITVPADAAALIASGGLKELVFEAPASIVSFDGKAIDTIMNSSEGDMALAVTTVEKDELDISQKDLEKIGDRPVYNFVVTKGDVEVSHFQGGKATISLPYTPEPGENLNAIVIYYVDSDGKLKTMRGHYDEDTGSAVFVTTHFSQFAIGYNLNNFEDVPDGYAYKNAIDFIAAREISLGVGDNKFGGNSDITRGMFLVMIMRAYDIQPDETWSDNFADAGDTYYTGFLGAAKRLGIVKGVGNNMYAPDRAITREEMFTLVYGVLQAIDEVPDADSSAKKIDEYLDGQSVSEWAREAATALVESKTIIGDGTSLQPQNNSSRAQMAQVLYNLLTK